MAVNRDVPVNIHPDVPPDQQLAFINQNFQTLSNSLNPFQISDGSNNIVFIGKDSAGNYVMKVAKAGFDAFNAANANLIFNSSQNMFKIVTSFTLTLTFTRSSVTYASYTQTQAHGLSFTPAFQAYLNIDSNISGVPSSYNFHNHYLLNANVGGTFTTYGEAYVTVNATNIYFQFDISNLASGTYTNTAKVYLMQETFS